MFDINEGVNLIFSTLQNWLETLFKMLPHLGLAIVIIFIALIIAKFARKTSLNVSGKVSQRETLNHLLSTIIYVFILLIGIFAALSILNLDKTVTSILAGAGIVGLALAFAFQDIAANFISGIIMAIRQPIEEGNVIETNDHMGTVFEVNLRSTILDSFTGQRVIIPNKEVLQGTIINYSKTGKRRVDVAVGVSYGDDLEKVKEITLATIQGLPFYNEEKSDVSFYYGEFGDSSINFTVRFWIDYPGQPNILQAKSDAIMAIKKAFDDNDIMIPFPIRTLDFGIKGGEQLHESLNNVSLKSNLNKNSNN